MVIQHLGNMNKIAAILFTTVVPNKQIYAFFSI